MDTQMLQLDLIMDLEARHEDLLRRLDELDKRVEKTLAECQVYRVRPENSQGTVPIFAAPATLPCELTSSPRKWDCPPRAA